MSNLSILIETTLNKLLSNTEQAFGDDRAAMSGGMRVTSTHIVPFQNGLRIKCNIHNSSEEQSDYETSILYENIEVGEEGELGFDIMATNGQVVSIRREDIEKGDVKVRCSCLDFYWRFAMWNFTDGSLDGSKPKPYVKKTNRPPNNPQRLPGMCKHLIATTDHLERLISTS